MSGRGGGRGGGGGDGGDKRGGAEAAARFKQYDYKAVSRASWNGMGWRGGGLFGCCFVTGPPACPHQPSSGPGMPLLHVPCLDDRIRSRIRATGSLRSLQLCVCPVELEPGANQRHSHTGQPRAKWGAGDPMGPHEGQEDG